MGLPLPSCHLGVSQPGHKLPKIHRPRLHRVGEQLRRRCFLTLATRLFGQSREFLCYSRVAEREGFYAKSNFESCSLETTIFLHEIGDIKQKYQKLR